MIWTAARWLGRLVSFALALLAVLVGMRLLERSIDGLAQATGRSDTATAVLFAALILACVIWEASRHQAKAIREARTVVSLQAPNLHDLKASAEGGDIYVVHESDIKAAARAAETPEKQG